MSSPSPPPTITSPSKKRLLANPKPRQDAFEDETLNQEPCKDKITRDLPNLSECHGCALRIDYSNPKARLQPLDSFWRIVLLCRRCIKQVNSGRACRYCFKGTMNSVSNCFTCSNCDGLVHKDCVTTFGNSPPWSYSCRGFDLGLKVGFSICIDCWVPDLLKKSIRVCRKHKNDNGVGKDDSGDKSFEDTMKGANFVVKNKVAIAAKAKEKALRKAVAAQNARELASTVLHFVGNASDEGLVMDSRDKGVGDSDVTKVVDDTELAFQLHRAMNSSPRITRNTCSVNLSRLDLYKKADSNISENRMDLDRSDDGMVPVGSNPKLNDESISEASANVRDKESRYGAVADRLESVTKFYMRYNLKRKDHSVNVEAGKFDHSREQSKAKVKKEGMAKAKSDRYSLKYRKKVTGFRQGLHKKASSCYVSSDKENKYVVLGLPAYRSVECSGSSGTSLRSCVVNLQ